MPRFCLARVKRFRPCFFGRVKSRVRYGTVNLQARETAALVSPTDSISVACASQNAVRSKVDGEARLRWRRPMG